MDKKVTTRKTGRKTGSTKIWLARSTETPEVLWIRGRTKPEAKKHLRHFLRSREYWEGEPDTETATTIFKSYSPFLSDCPGIRVDDTRGDVLMSLSEPALDWIDREEDGNNKSSEEKEKSTS